MRRPSLKASATVVPAPGISECASYQAFRCSSDRKKFSAVQSELEIRRSPSLRLATQTMIPAASAAGPSAPAKSASGSLQWWQRDRIRIGWRSIAATPKASMAQHA